MRAYLVIIIALAMAGLGASFWLVPGQKEVALMRFLDADFEKARMEYELQLAAGDWSINVVVPLTKLYLQAGQIDDAADLMEDFVEREPNNVQARLVLGEYYQFAQRPDDYLHNLEEIVALEPTEARFRELSDIYNFNADINSQIKALTELITRYEAVAGDFRVLASLQASQRQFEDALRTIRVMRERYPTAIDADVAELFTSLLLDADMPQEALDFSAQWLSQNGQSPQVAARLSSLFSFKGAPKEGLALLRPYESIVDDHPTLLAEYTRLQVDLGEVGEAYQRLLRLFEEDRLPQEAADIIIGLALERQENDLALDIADAVELSLLPNWLLVALAEVTVVEGRPDYSRQMIDRLGPAFLSNRPALAAEVYLASGDEETAREWVQKAERTKDPTVAETTRLARVYARLEEFDNAIRLLHELVRNTGAADASVLGDLVQAYLRADRSEDGVHFFDELRQSKARPAVETGWAVLAADAGYTGDVLAWLDKAEEDELYEALVLDIYFIAGDKKADRLRLAAAERLLEARDVPVNRTRFLQAILDARLEARFLSPVRDFIEDRENATQRQHVIMALKADGYSVAAEWLEVRGASGATEVTSPDDNTVIFEILRALRAAGEPSRERLAGYVAGAERALDLEQSIGEGMRRQLRNTLSQPNLSVIEREIAVSELLSLGDEEGAFNALETLAREAGTSWAFTFIEVANNLGRQDQLLEFLLGRLAADDVSQEEQDQYLYSLLDSFGPSEALPYLKRNAYERGGAWLFAYEDALSKVGDNKGLVAFLLDLSRDDTRPAEERSTLAFRLLKLGHKSDAERVFLELAEEGSPDSDAVRQLLYLWGPRPGHAGEEWIVDRLNSAKGEERVAWFKLLLDSTGYARGIELAGDLHAAGPDHGIGALQLDALLQLERRNEFEALLRTLSAQAEDRATRETYGNLAYREGLIPLAIALLNQVRREGGLSNTGLRRLALASFYSGDREKAYTLLAKYHAKQEGDADTNQIFAELLFEHNKHSQARRFYRRALDFAVTKDDNSFEHRRRLAFLMTRADQEDEAVDAYRALMEERPDLKDLRVEYAEFLLSRGAEDRARNLVGSSSNPIDG